MPLNAQQLKQLTQLELRARSEQFIREDGRLVKALIASHIELFNLLKDPNATLDDLAPFLASDESDTASDRNDALPESRDE